MIKIRQLCVLSALLLASTSVRSIDTDIYLNASANTPPNVIFSLDNSNSMVNNRLLVPPDYDPGNTYTGVFSDDQVYLSLDGRIPSSLLDVSHTSMVNAEHCDYGQTHLNTDGFVAIRAAVAFSGSANLSRYAADFWYPANRVEFELPTDGQAYIECEDDSGNHGAAGGGGGDYASRSLGELYTSNASNEIDWEKFPFVVMYTGNFLNYKVNPGPYVKKSRTYLQNRVVVDAIKRTPEIFAGLAIFDRLGLGRTSVNTGAIDRAAKDNSIRANQLELLSHVENIPFVGVTPLGTTLLEVLHYYHGQDPFAARTSVTDPAALETDGSYQSPIQWECQKNYVLFVTDGRPFRDSLVTPAFVSSSADYPEYASLLGRTSCSGDSCLDDIAGYLAGKDADTNLDDDQTVQVYPVGMELELELLEDTATAAGTESYYAKNADEFENAIIDILANIKASQAVSMMTASSSFNAFSKVANRDFLYFGMFAPESTFQWKGNLKKYRIAYENSADNDPSNDVAYVTDQRTSDPNIALSDGSLMDSAHSYWSANPDGNNTLSGGVLDRLTRQGSRNIKGINNWGTGAQQIFVAANTLSLTDTFFNSAVGATDRSDAERANIVNYALGQDVKDDDGDQNVTEQRGHIGAMVRSGPVAVQYGGTQANPILVVYALTTDGMLHAFNEITGDELWAVMITDAYPHLVDQYDNNGSLAPWWGIDGSITPRVIDENSDGVINGADKVYLYINAGLGLRKWVILDVTNALSAVNPAKLISRSEPLLKPDGSLNSGWDEFGLSTARLVPLSYRLNMGLKKSAFLYANGMDPSAEFSYGESTMGRGLTIHAADTADESNFGDILWKATATTGGYPDMDFGFAATPTTIDTDGDGLTDLIYAVDLNAQIWRFHVNKGATATSNLFSGGILAKLGADSDGNRRRAYKSLDAAVVRSGSGQMVLLAVGTGDRMNPLATTDQDRLHVIQDHTAFSGAVPSSIIRPSDLYDATSNTLSQSDQTSVDALQSKLGWYINISSSEGQKAISAPLIVAGVVYFPVYRPALVATHQCNAGDLGQGLLYRMNVLTGEPAVDVNGDSLFTTSDRFTVLNAPGIPGDVALHTSSTGIRTAFVNLQGYGASQVANPIDTGSEFTGNYWFEPKK